MSIIYSHKSAESFCCTPKANIILQIKYTSIPKTNKNANEYLRIYLYCTVWYKPSLTNDILTLCAMSVTCDSHITILYRIIIFRLVASNLQKWFP